jgi:hypothetical protein
MAARGFISCACLAFHPQGLVGACFANLCAMTAFHAQMTNRRFPELLTSFTAPPRRKLSADQSARPMRAACAFVVSCLNSDLNITGSGNLALDGGLLIWPHSIAIAGSYRVRRLPDYRVHPAIEAKR